jgi:transcriptional regulator with XRE-family HTH domain
MTNQPLTQKTFVPGTSRLQRRTNTLLAQMADLARGERIKGLREERHLTQPAVAEAVGVTLRAYQAWEGTGGLRWENAKKLAAFFDVDPHELWAGRRHGQTPDPFSKNGDVPDDLQREIRELHRKLDILIEGLGLKPTTLEPTQEATEVVAAIERQHAETAPTATAKTKPSAARSPRA